MPRGSVASRRRRLRSTMTVSAMLSSPKTSHGNIRITSTRLGSNLGKPTAGLWPGPS
ncbi:hypothetical protein FOMG_18622 [Fusarium oxysporum f. sp. melonis 26406]|uniref:Uncharacterized protein n=1 Tax=Fusarium oxysporum f. sp. melonis 26406 TaxID=1089452 RepID=W9Z8T3_FUSOX|nr:hypothetical protein FOMG_18622 [Fusarium oxysporum f. sp. melonis 26406]